MFTGLIETIGRIVHVRRTAAGKSLHIDLGRLAEGTAIGDSIAVSGVCLTVTALNGTTGQFDVMAQTLSHSTLGTFTVGTSVNLERAAAVGDRLGGHLVQGHVDGTGTVGRIDRRAGQHWLWITPERELLGDMILRGSVAIDGVSLTIAELTDAAFAVSLIPETLSSTTLQYLKPGDTVNLETDQIGKWVKRHLQTLLGQSPGTGGRMTIDDLRRQGF